jgi:hyperosmotically inducible protein
MQQISRLSITAALVLGLAACQAWRDYFGGTQRGAEGTRSAAVDDSALTARVRDALRRDAPIPDPAQHSINASSSGGTVTLSGIVDSPATAQRAIIAASGVSGVKSVNNQLQVRSQKP